MNNKIFFKIGAVLSLIIIAYVFFITFVITPKITSYLVELETKQAQIQLDRISAIIDSKENYLKEFRSIRITQHRKNIRNISYIAQSILKNHFEMYEKGLLSKEEAFNSAIKVISKIRYGHKDDYIFILDKQGTLVFHPDKRYHKKNIFNTKDYSGRRFVDEIIKNSISEGETYTSYTWSKLNSDLVSEKIVHSLYINSFDVIISTGVYLQNIKQELEIEKEKVVRELDPFIKSIMIEDSGYIFVMNSKYNIVLHPDDDLINKNLKSIGG